MILDLDVGNSYVKWRVTGGVAGRIESQYIGQLKRSISERIARVRAVCVLDDVSRVRIAEEIQREFFCLPEFACSSLACAGLENQYNSPAKLGVDRWLAAIAAHKISKELPCLVIDAGSALTIDTVDDRSGYIGGYIIPGLSIMQHSLSSSTGQIDCEVVSGFDHDYLTIPANTKQAVHRGACFAAVSSAKYAIEDFLQRWPNGKVFITGGDGERIAFSLNRENDYFQDLVLDGLALALP